MDRSELVDRLLDPDAVHAPLQFADEPTVTDVPPDEGDSKTDAVPSGKDDA